MSAIFFGQVLTALIGIPFVFFTQGTVTTAGLYPSLFSALPRSVLPYILLALATNHCPPLALSDRAIEPL